MNVVIECLNGPHSGRRHQIRAGCVTQFGRTEWADVSFPGDEAMADYHFQLDCRNRAVVLTSLHDAPTAVNDQPVAQQTLRNGDVIVAGQSRLRLHLQGAIEPEAEAPAPEASNEPAAAGLTGLELHAALELDPQTLPIAEQAESSEQFIDNLMAADFFGPAMRVQAYVLPKPDAVRWACDCVQNALGDSLPQPQAPALEAARAWSEEPGEDRGREAEAAAAAIKNDGIGAMLALAAFWSGENIAPADVQGAIPPDERLTSQAILSALLLTAYHPPGDANSRWTAFREAAKSAGTPAS